MNIAIQTTRYMVWLHVILAVGFFALGVFWDQSQLLRLGSIGALTSLLFFLVLQGLHYQFLWVALPFLVFLYF